MAKVIYLRLLVIPCIEGINVPSNGVFNALVASCYRATPLMPAVLT